MSEDRRVEELEAELESVRRELARVTAELTLLKSTPQLELSQLWQFRLRLFPPGSARERVARRGLHTLARGARLLSGSRRRASGDVPAPAGVAGPSTTTEAESYDTWARRREPDAAQLAHQREIARAFAHRPLVSVICPVFAPPADVFAETVASVRAQTYDRWELVLVKAGPQPPALETVLAALTRDGDRIVIVELDENRGIAGNTNAGLDAARGDYVCFLDHDDLIAPDALYEVVRLLNEDPAAEVVYFDEDKITADGSVRCDPYFKPDWSPDHLLSINFLMHSVVRKATLDAVGRLDGQYDGAQDWDLALRLAEHGVTPRHIPRVLYHWRKLPGSAASDALAKPWALDRQAPCVKAHLERRGFTGVSVVSPELGVLRSEWQGRGTRVSIIIPTKDRASLVRTCLSSILSITDYPDFEVLLVDTGSTEGATQALYEEMAGEPRLRLLSRGGEFNFSGVNNWAATQASGDILLFLNNDIEVLDAGWLAEMARWAELDEVGCVGAKLLYPNGTIQHAGLVVGMEGHASQIFRFEPGDHHWSPFASPEFYRNPLAVTGACLAVRRSVFDRVGGFDETYRLCYNDIDLCLRVAAAGCRNVYTPFAKLIHHEGASRGFHVPGDEVLKASVEMFPLVMAGDPSFNPQLTYSSVSPRLAKVREPEMRADRIALIARSFNVYDEWTREAGQELRGETRRWSKYAPLLNPGPRGRRDTAAGPGQLRILLVSHDLSRSGAPMLAAHLAQFLQSRGQQVTVVSPNHGPMREEFESRGARVIVEPGIQFTPHGLDRLFREHDVVLANTILSWRVVSAAPGLGVPAIWVIHESAFGAQYARAHRAIAHAFASASRVLFPSRDTESRYRDFDAGRHAIVHYGIEPVSAGPPAFEKDPAKLYVLVVGNIEARKGQDVLVAAVAQLPELVRRHVEVTILGEVYEPEFGARVQTEAARVGGIRLLPACPFQQMIDLMGTVDVVVCPSRDDPSPLVVFEAMALGRAVVATRVGANLEILVDGESGLLVESEQPRAMADALVRLYEDRTLGPRLGARAREHYQAHLTLERYGTAVLDELASAVARGVR